MSSYDCWWEDEINYITETSAWHILSPQQASVTIIVAGDLCAHVNNWDSVHGVVGFCIFILYQL